MRPKLSYANVTATLALFLTMTGGTWALSSRGIPDSTGTFHGCVSKRTGVLRIAKSPARCVKRGRRAEFAIRWSQRGPEGPAGIRGQDGTPGADGAPGQPGAPGATKVAVRTVGVGFATASCGPGEVAVGGGGDGAGGALTRSRPEPASGTPTAWTVTANGVFVPQAYVVCARP